jgi:hypothetical protein
MKKKMIMFWASLLFVYLVSCYPQGPEYYEELDIVYTNYDDQFNFESAGSYSMPDKIVKITGNLADGQDPEFVKEPYGSQMLQLIESNMSDLGWTRTGDPADADLVLFPAVWTNTTIYYWYDYWCWYSYYYCGWGWGWYYPTATSITTGTLVMTLVADGDDYVEPALVWTAAVNGLLSGSYNTSRVTKGVDQAFEQSPYLNTK